MSVLAELDRYFVMRELRQSSEQQMRIYIAVFLKWCGQPDIPIEELTGVRISKFLAAKQTEGRRCHYRRSLRNALKALHRFSRNYVNCDPIREVRLDDLDPDSWTTEQVAKLVKACDRLPYCDRNWWRTFILAGYYTGLNAIDLHRITRASLMPEGHVVINRSKTGKRTFTAMPQNVMAEVLAFAPAEGPVWELKTSDEAFRMRFRRLVRLAGIPAGSFKQLRKTSGTLLEKANPGKGHVHLGNTAEIFKKHYEDVKVTQANPTMPPELPLD